MTIGCILWLFGIFDSHLVYVFFPFWYVVPKYLSTLASILKITEEVRIFRLLFLHDKSFVFILTENGHLWRFSHKLFWSP
jgi:hypothetical protein